MYIKNYEIATNSKFIKNRAIRMSVSGKHFIVTYDPRYGVNSTFWEKKLEAL
jgi:hypothetical protein